MSKSQPRRLRTPPRERFSGETQSFDLERIFEKLAEEAQAPIDGHHQITLFKSGASTVMAFLFDAEGYLPRHQADGIVAIEVIDGRVEVETPKERHALGTRGLLVLRPGVPHEVHASEPTKMVVTIHLQPNRSTEE